MFSRFVTGTTRLKKQMITLIIGSILVFAANILSSTPIIPRWLDLAPITMTIALILCTVSIVRYKLFDIASVSVAEVVDNMGDSMIVFDAGGSYAYCNKEATSLFPFLHDLFGSEDLSNIADWPDMLPPKTHFGDNEIKFERADRLSGEMRTYSAMTSLVNDINGRLIGYSLVIRDMTETTKMTRELELLATRDSLTKIANRRYFIEFVTRELVLSSRINLTNTLIMCDIDHFKKINDTYGHYAGDVVLCAVVDTLKAQLRSYDVFARYGGEEFVIFTTSGFGEKTIGQFAQRLCDAVANANIKFDGIAIKVTCSFGVVSIPPGTNYDDAMLAADAAMYMAKNTGRNRIFVGDLPSRKKL
ncbi:hypothetical protein FACS1894219_03500 [Clostridia bacterium]|nr:hypothetical protein FACS1894219_03500 [Clostridia bacterium]